MAVKKQSKVSRTIITKAREVLAFAEQRASELKDSIQLWNALYSPDGKATLVFKTEAERIAFSKTREYKQILALMESLPKPPVTEHLDLTATANGAISVRLPRSVHAALLVEADVEGVSLNQLCVAKLVAQLRSII